MRLMNTEIGPLPFAIARAGFGRPHTGSETVLVFFRIIGVGSVWAQPYRRGFVAGLCVIGVSQACGNAVGTSGGGLGTLTVVGL